jgi:hypothetical protein
MFKKKILGSLVFAIAVAASSTSAFAWHCRGYCQYTLWEATPIGWVWVNHHMQVHGRDASKRVAKILMKEACAVNHGWAVVNHRCSQVEIIEEILIGQAGEKPQDDAIAAASLQDSCAAVNELIDDDRFAKSCSEATREAPPKGLGTSAIALKSSLPSDDLSSPAALDGNTKASLALPPSLAN